MTTVNGVKYVNKPLPSSKQSLKATNPMKPKGYTLHNTYNDASAVNEINYMQNVNPKSTSFTYAIDNLMVVQGLPLDRNGWHAGDGTNGYGNRNTYGVEICYSKSGGERYDEAETKTILFVAQGLYDNDWDISKVWKHKDWSGKNCPHRILARSRGWEGIINAIQQELDRLKGKKPVTSDPKPPVQPKPSSPSVSNKSIDQLAKEVISGDWKHGEERKKLLGDKYSEVQKRVNEMLAPKPVKTIEELAHEVIAGKWDHGDKRKKLLGGRYNDVQKRVNQIMADKSKPKVQPKPAKTIDQLAHEVIAGKHLTGDKRKKSLGSQYDAVQKRVNQILGSKSRPSKKTISQLADEVNRGLHGTGRERMISLGSDYAAVQKEINRRMRR